MSTSLSITTLISRDFGKFGINVVQIFCSDWHFNCSNVLEPQVLHTSKKYSVSKIVLTLEALTVQINWSSDLK